MRKLIALGSALSLGIFSASAQVTNTAAQVKTEIDGLTTNAGQVFDAIVPVVLAVVGLGILLAFAKMIKKR